MCSNMFNQIKQAMKDKQQIVATYKEYPREFCPTTLGWNEYGIERVFGYQFAGDSNSGLEPLPSIDNWRCFDIDLLINVSFRNGTWHAYSTHSRPQNCIAHVDFEVYG